MGKRKAENKAVQDKMAVVEEELHDAGADNLGEGVDGFEVERDAYGKLTGVRIINDYIDPDQNYILRLNSTVLVQAGEKEHKYLGYIRDLNEADGDIQVLICWFYRVSDLQTPPRDLATCRARLEGKPGGGDKGRFKELFFSNHTDHISIHSVMYPITVWLLPSESLEPVTIPPEAGPLVAAAAAAAGPTDHGSLLPGFICRRMYDIKTKEVFPLSEVPSRKRQLGRWLVDDVAALLRQSEQERQTFMREWVQRCKLRAERAALSEQLQKQTEALAGVAEAGAAGAGAS